MRERESIRRVGLYGGTFDPIHFGHLNLAIELMERHGLAEVWFCPARISPHRLNCPPTASHHRLEMIQEAIRSIPAFRVLELELEREGPSFTIDTVRSLRVLFPEVRLSLLLSEEAALTFGSWKEAEQIVNLAPPIVGKRDVLCSGAPVTGNAKIDRALREGMTSMPALDISGSQIRERLQKGKYCGHLMPQSSLIYAQKHSLYE